MANNREGLPDSQWWLDGYDSHTASYADKSRTRSRTWELQTLCPCYLPRRIHGMNRIELSPPRGPRYRLSRQR